jgi:hypothetical protein
MPETVAAKVFVKDKRGAGTLAIIEIETLARITPKIATPVVNGFIRLR